jgi:hypothetical protein
MVVVNSTAAGGVGPGGLPPAGKKFLDDLAGHQGKGAVRRTSPARSLSARHDPMQQLLPLAAPRPPKNQALLYECLLDVVNQYAPGEEHAIKRKHLFAMVHRTAEALSKNRDPKAPTPKWSDSQCRIAYEEIQEAGQAVTSTRRGYFAIVSWQDQASGDAAKAALISDLKNKRRLLYANTLRKLGPPPPGYHIQQELLPL